MLGYILHKLLIACVILCFFGTLKYSYKHKAIMGIYVFTAILYSILYFGMKQYKLFHYTDFRVFTIERVYKEKNPKKNEFYYVLETTNGRYEFKEGEIPIGITSKGSYLECYRKDYYGLGKILNYGYKAKFKYKLYVYIGKKDVILVK